MKYFDMHSGRHRTTLATLHLCSVHLSTFRPQQEKDYLSFKETEAQQNRDNSAITSPHDLLACYAWPHIVIYEFTQGGW